MKTGSARTTVIATLLALTVYPRTGVSEVHDFSRYKVILDRAPFDPLTAAANPAQKPSFCEGLAYVGTVSSEDGTTILAIIQDRGRNRSYFKAEGEKIDDIKVEKIQMKPAKVVVVKGLERCTLTYEERGGAAGAVPGMMPQPGPPQPGQAPPQPRRIPFRRGS